MTITARIDRINAIGTAHRCAAPPAPLSVKIELTARCNFAFSFCARSQNLRDQKDMDRAVFERLVREFRQAVVDELDLLCLVYPFLVARSSVAL